MDKHITIEDDSASDIEVGEYTTSTSTTVLQSLCGNISKKHRAVKRVLDVKFAKL